jgi:aminopeptidase N
MSRCPWSLPMLPGLLLAAAVTVGAAAAAPPGACDVTAYTARVEPQPTTGTVSGRVAIGVTVSAPGAATLTLDTGHLGIDSVTVDGGPAPWQATPGHLRVELPGGADATAAHTVAIAYHGTPTGGLVFRPEARQFHTEFSTSQWLPCVDAPAERATLDLTLIVPADLVVAATGDWQSSEPAGEGLVASHWRLDAAQPSYLYGFAAGPFRECMTVHDGVTLRVLATPSFSADEAARVFADTGAMLDFLAMKAGRPYPGNTYTQVLLAGGAAQEAAGLTLLGERYGRRVLADSSATWLGAHELAHQWWGNRVTNAAWTHFWLNEGFASYLADLWLAERHGPAAYDKALAAVRASVEAVRARGHDRSLVFPDWDHPTADDRSLVYDKGALVLESLRAEVGPGAFDRILQAWTNEYWDRSVTTADFESLAQRVSGRDLATFFASWLHATQP